MLSGRKTLIKLKSLINFIKSSLDFQVLYLAHSFVYVLTWLSAQGRTCAVYTLHVMLNRYSTWNRKKITFCRSIMSVIVELQIRVGLFILMQFNLRNFLSNYGIFLPVHPVYIYTGCLFVYRGMIFYLASRINDFPSAGLSCTT